VPYRVGFIYPGATCWALEAHCSCPTLSYKRLGQVPLPRDRKNGKGSGKAGLSTIELSSPVDVGYYAQAARTKIIMSTMLTQG
jgi:hypothetical protein